MRKPQVTEIALRGTTVSTFLLIIFATQVLLFVCVFLNLKFCIDVCFIKK